MSYRRTRIRRDALPAETNAMLRQVTVGNRVYLTFYGVESEAVIADLDDVWVEFWSSDPA